MPTSGCFSLEVRVITNAATNNISGWQGERLKIKLKSPPVGERENKLPIEYLSFQLNLPRRSISIARGEKSPLKTVEIAGLDFDEFKKRLQL